MDLELIIFDLDGTLVNAYPAIIESFNYTLKRLNYPRQKSRIIRSAVGWGDDNLLRPFIRQKDLSCALSIYRRHHRVSLIKKSRLFPGASKILRYLRNKGHKLAVASNRPTEFSWILLRHLRLERYFDYVLCADKLKHVKPHPEILKKIMQRFQAKPNRTVYVGDMTIDAQAGRRAGVRTIIVTTGSSARQSIKKEGPYRIISKIADLSKIF